MKAIVSFVVVAVALGAFWIAWNSPELKDRRAAENYHQGYLQSVERQRADLALEADRAAQPARLAMAPVSVIALGAFGLVAVGIVLGLSAAFGGAAVKRFREERRPDRMGRLPVPVAQLEHASVAALAAFHQAQIEAARKPAQITLHPGVDAGRTALALADESAGAVAVPSFGDLLSAGRVGKGNPLILGYDLESGEELPGTWADLYSTITAGLPGTGKTTSQRFYACQTALHGAKFVLCDPHQGSGADSLAETLAPLSSVFLCEPASAPKQILEAARFVADIGAQRLAGRSGERNPVILWVDELTALLGRGDVGGELASVLEQIAQEHRKVAVYLAASGQIWTASRTTSELRDSMASVLAHRMKRSQARLLLPTEEAQMVERLEVGQAVLWRTSGATSRVQIPLTTAADVAAVAARLTGPDGRASTLPAARPFGFVPAPVDAPRPGDGRDDGRDRASASGSDKAPFVPPDAETARLLARFAAGASIHDLASELAGTNNPGSRAYKAARERVESLLRMLAGETAAAA